MCRKIRDVHFELRWELLEPLFQSIMHVFGEPSHLHGEWTALGTDAL